MASPSQEPSVRLADLQKIVEQLSEPKQQEVLWLVQELLEGQEEPSDALKNAQANFAQERIDRALANPDSVVDGIAWLKTEQKKRGW